MKVLKATDKVPPLKVFPNLELDTPGLKDAWRFWVAEVSTMEERHTPDKGEQNFREWLECEEAQAFLKD